MFKKIISIFLITIFITSCGGSFDSVKRGLTGAKKIQADEFLVQKKSPLVMPPEFDVLPIPKELKSRSDSGSKSIEELISGSNSQQLEKKTDKEKKISSSIEKLILEKIKNN